MICFVRLLFYDLIKYFYFFGNHLKGQDILHVDVYDKDLIFDDKIGSVQINLQDLFEHGF